MQKPLNTHGFSLDLLWRGKLLNTKTGLLLATVLLLLIQSTQIASAQAGFVSDFIKIKGRIGTVPFSDKYYTNSNSADQSVTKQFDGVFLGTFNRTFDGTTLVGIDSLLINAEANTKASNGDLVSSTQLLYRISRQDGGGEPGSDIPLPLTLTAGDAGSEAQWVSANNRTNLINSALSPGTWVLEVSFQGNATVNKKPQPIVDGRYTAFFNVQINGQDVITQTWSASPGNTNWLVASNWTPNGIPTQNSDIVIPFISGGSYPIITTGVALAHNILISGRGTSTGARLTLKGGQLRIFGDFQDANGGFSQSAVGLQGDAGILTLAGTTQTFDAAPKLFNLTIQGGGVKTLTRLITLNGNLTFGAGGGILVTRTDNPGQYGINFIGQNNGIRNETANGYVLGVVSTSVEDVQNGQPYDFSSIGVVLTVNNKHINATSVGTVYATRISNVYSEPGSGSSIRRGYFFSTETAEPQDFDMTFNYLTPDLNGNQPNNLQIYRSETGDYPFEKLGKDTSGPGVVSKSGIVGLLSATFTLGEIVPLPVTLVSFTATPAAQGAALLRWNTATETNNKGFGIERQLGKGQPWQSIGYLATGNSASGGTYTYTDKTLANAPSSPLAYYRLRQEDQDGKLNYSPVAVIARSGEAASTALQLSPVPVTGSTISLAFAEVGQAGAEISITNTQGQRLFTQTTQASSEAVLSLPVERLAAGVYIVSVRVPGQAARHARFVKL